MVPLSAREIYKPDFKVNLEIKGHFWTKITFISQIFDQNVQNFPIFYEKLIFKWLYGNSLSKNRFIILRGVYR